MYGFYWLCVSSFNCNWCLRVYSSKWKTQLCNVITTGTWWRGFVSFMPRQTCPRWMCQLCKLVQGFLGPSDCPEKEKMYFLLQESNHGFWLPSSRSYLSRLTETCNLCPCKVHEHNPWREQKEMMTSYCQKSIVRSIGFVLVIQIFHAWNESVHRSYWQMVITGG